MASVHQRSASQPVLPVKTTAPPEVSTTYAGSSIGGAPTLFQFVHTVPAPLTSALVGLSPCLTAVRHGLQVLSWKAGWEEIYGKYLLPVLLLVGIALAKNRARRIPAEHPLTEIALQSAVSDLNAVQSLLPSLPSLPTTPLPNLLRASAIIYVPYIILTYLVPLRVLLGLAGTLLLTHRATWAIYLRRTLWKSAWIRWTTYRIWSSLSGLPFPDTLPPAPIHAESISGEPIARLRFLFTIYENQRWWMGLDFTAALLPNERPSWCGPAPGLAPLPPPSAFTLPDPSASFISDGRGGRLRRTAVWTWEEPEWKVLMRREGETVSGREVRTVPTQREDGSAAQRLRKLMDAGAASVGTSNASGSPSTATVDLKPEDEEKVDVPVEDEVTDGDGWVYGDNKWENRSAKGGMGKYTRYRRWTRIAVLQEIVEPVEPGPLGVLREDDPAAMDEPEKLDHAPARTPSPEATRRKPVSASPQSSLRSVSPDEQRTGRLRARLQAAIKGQAGS
ncbi:hypothetical protein PENSPDRAFT_753111 [Peniophora sp. CONT]|nr:hypothetical protein PENSPDRAFT_753111 [Peniophora sp. CONT]